MFQIFWTTILLFRIGISSKLFQDPYAYQNPLFCVRIRSPDMEMPLIVLGVGGQNTQCLDFDLLNG